ncbi:hypothetical protein BLNAU_17643 [Blattamonas nauphoetae]|uniref:Uncharacterized protein n=1 Tax=Blattamonas nauphoetae TaxID=2049346 RepID=A0ABQ9X9M3_9EUKA|nr:hypothetical protein BLNAU_17643 [Blattamonas nauphoetae]
MHLQNESKLSQFISQSSSVTFQSISKTFRFRKEHSFERIQIIQEGEDQRHSTMTDGKNIPCQGSRSHITSFNSGFGDVLGFVFLPKLSSVER